MKELGIRWRSRSDNSGRNQPFLYPVKQDYLNPGIPEGEDKERAENARWERLLEIAERTNDNRPVMTSEYAHCMGNALR